MTRVETVRLTLPCPTCHVPQPLVAAYRSDPNDGRSRAVLPECTRCWTIRARALNEARAGLRSAGDLAGSGTSTTWRGELLSSDHEHDGLEGALLSALLRRDVRTEPRAELVLPAALPRETPAKAGSGG